MAEQYFTQNPSTAHDIKVHEVNYAGTAFRFQTDSGVFSKSGLDEGTEFLLDALLPEVHGRVLDLGCGWGAVGVIVGVLKPGCDIVMTDINQRAVDLAHSNAAMNKVKARIVQSDGYEHIEGLFDWIMLNPPIRAGKQAIYELFKQGRERLMPGGTMGIVIRKQQGALSARDYLETIYDQVDLAHRKKGYHVYRCKRGME